MYGERLRQICRQEGQGGGLYCERHGDATLTHALAATQSSLCKFVGAPHLLLALNYSHAERSTVPMPWGPAAEEQASAEESLLLRLVRRPDLFDCVACHLGRRGYVCAVHRAHLSSRWDLGLLLVLCGFPSFEAG